MRKAIVGTRRSITDIVLEILSVCHYGGAGRTAIMYRCNLSHDQVVRYLTSLSEGGFIRENTNGTFAITDKGEGARKHLEAVQDILNELRDEWR